MRTKKSPEQATLLDVLVACFEKNEVMYGYHWRDLPMPDETAAKKKFSELAEEAERWKGRVQRHESTAARDLAGWDDLEIRRAGRGLMVRAKAPDVDDWWDHKATWFGDPMAPLYEWLDEERERELKTT